MTSTCFPPGDSMEAELAWLAEQEAIYGETLLVENGAH